MGFRKGFEKVATGKGLLSNHKALDQAGLGLLAVPVAYHGYKALKKKDKTEVAMAGTELGGLGLLSRAVSKAK